MVGSPLMNMNTSLLPQQNNGQMGMAILQAALKAGAPGAGGGTPPVPGDPSAQQPLSLAPPNPGPGNGLLSKIFGGGQPTPPTPPIDPNTGLPVTPDVMAGAAGMGGAGPSPTALTGLW
jgi:hypothetical protein